MIELDELLSKVVEEILIHEEYTFGKEYLDNTDILGLSSIKVDGKIIENSSNEVVICAIIKGEMVLEDSINLEAIKYPFMIELDEEIEKNYINNENVLDIMEFLWQNIVLEVPLRYTVVSDTSNIKGNGWKLVSEEELHNNNPFSILLEDKEKE